MESFIDRQSSYGSISNDLASPHHTKKLARPPRSLSLPWELTFLQSQSKRSVFQDDSPIPTESFSSNSPRPRDNSTGSHKPLQIKGKSIIRRYITILRVVEPKSSKSTHLKYQRFHRLKKSNCKSSTDNIKNSIQQLISKDSSKNLTQIRSDLIQISNGINQLLSHLDNLQSNRPILLHSPTTPLTPPTPPSMSRQNSRNNQFTTPSPKQLPPPRGNFSNLRSLSVSNSLSQNSPSIVKTQQQHIRTSSPLNIERSMITHSNDKNEKPSISERTVFRSSNSYHHLEDTG